MPENNLTPFDVKKLKDAVLQESARLKLRSFSAEGETSFTLALALSAAVKKVFFEKSEKTFSSEPVLEKKPVVQFVHRMRIDAMEKFNTTTVFSAVQFSSNEEGLQQQEYILTLVVYLEKKFLPEFLRLLQYPYIDFDNEAEVKDGCGTLANLFAGQYKKEIALLGYKDLMMAPFDAYINTAADGVMIPKGTTDKYEISFEVEETKRLVVEMMTIAILPKWRPLDNAPPRKILVVDDDPTFLKVIEPFLQSHGFKVIVARDGDEGLKRLAEKPQLIVLDIQMPNMDGYEFVLQKKKLDGVHQIPVIVLTAKEGMAEMFKVEGAREYLLKPLQPEILLRSIQRYI